MSGRSARSGKSTGSSASAAASSSSASASAPSSSFLTTSASSGATTSRGATTTSASGTTGGASASGSSGDPWTWGSVAFSDEGQIDPATGEPIVAEGDETPAFVGGKDSVIFLIDCSPSMFDVFEAGESEGDADKTFFSRSVEAAYNTLSNKVVCSAKDLVAVVFFGTDSHRNSGDFKHIYVLQDLDIPDVKRIKELEDMSKEGYDFGSKYGSSDDYSISDALWVCSNLFSNASHKVASRRILLFTNNDSPHTADHTLQRQAITKAKDLSDVGVDIDLLHMSKAGQAFSIAKFYSEIITIDDSGEYSGCSEGFDSLLVRVRVKTHNKRSLMTIPLRLAEGFDIGVKVYNLTGETNKGSYVWLDSASNEEVQTKTRHYCAESAQTLLPTQIKSAMEYGKEQVVFEKDEVAAMKRFDEPGLVLMGFKPKERLKMQYNVKNSSFAYPDDGIIEGSTRVFAAMWEECIAQDKVAICRLIPRMNAEPRFVALLPSRERLDENGTQVIPPGMAVIFLPYADDMRKLPYETGRPKANEDQISKVQKIVKRLDFPNFSPESFENPALQNHYRNLEALAMDRDEPEKAPDLTEPDLAQMLSTVGKYTKAAKEVLFPDDYDPDAAAAVSKSGVASSAAKRKAATEAKVEKKAKASEALEGHDIEALYKSDELNKLTVPVLKAFLTTIGKKVSGKKAELVESVAEYFRSK